MAPLNDDMEEFLHRKVVIRMFWDGEENPSVQAPIGDFFWNGSWYYEELLISTFANEPGRWEGIKLLLSDAFWRESKIRS